MKIIKKQDIRVKDRYKTLNRNTLIKEFEHDFIPRKGDFLIDAFYYDKEFIENSYEVNKVVIDYDINECCIVINPIVIYIEDMRSKTYEELILEAEKFSWFI